ncbi:MAG: DEAD/DEAH box helicase [Xenococcus sp. MO_188.B8]|nr:DEAD/DEAH box helicase [Xenococcus sp. MO_188.B8]
MIKKTNPHHEIIAVPKAIANEVKLFINLLNSGEIDSFSDLLDLAGFSNLTQANISDLTAELAVRNITKDITNHELTLTIDQEKAFSQLKNFTESNDKFFRLTGYAGTGKSFLITHYIRWLKNQKLDFIAACPTNKAAKSLRTLADNEGIDIDVKTIAQLLGQQPEFNEKTGEEEFISAEKLDFSGYGIIIIDEFSMVNKNNFEDIVNEVEYSLFTKIVFVGDAAQLPPVKEKEPIVATSDIIELESTLTEVVRYDGEIARVAESIRSNNQYSRTLYPFTTTKDQTILCLPQSEWLVKAITLFQSPEYQLNPDHVRFLAWRNKTVATLNKFVRSKLWGKDVPPYVPGDRLIARKPLFRVRPGGKGKNKWGILINNSEEAQVIETGILCEVNFQGHNYKYWKVKVQLETGSSQTLSILHEDSLLQHKEQVKNFASKKQWQYYFDLSRMFDDVGYAYALTTHKAQGSTIDYVFLDVNDMRGCGDRQKLLYTAITRAKKQALIPH